MKQLITVLALVTISVIAFALIESPNWATPFSTTYDKTATTEEIVKGETMLKYCSGLMATANRVSHARRANISKQELIKRAKLEVHEIDLPVVLEVIDWAYKYNYADLDDYSSMVMRSCVDNY